MRETIDIGSGENCEIPFVLYPTLCHVAHDFACELFKLKFSLRVCILFSNNIRCIHCLPVHFSF